MHRQTFFKFSPTERFEVELVNDAVDRYKGTKYFWDSEK